MTNARVTYQDLDADISAIAKEFRGEGSSGAEIFFRKSKFLSDEDLDSRLVKCFFSSYYENYSTVQSKNLLFRCRGMRFKAIKCSSINYVKD